MEYWESLQFERILKEWDSAIGKEAFFSSEAYRKCPISFNLYDIECPKGIRPTDDVIDFQVKCPHCNTVHICHVPDQSREVEYLRYYFAKCTHCQELFHLLSNFVYRKTERPLCENSLESSISVANFGDHISMYDPETGTHIKMYTKEHFTRTHRLTQQNKKSVDDDNFALRLMGTIWGGVVIIGLAVETENTYLLNWVGGVLVSLFVLYLAYRIYRKHPIQWKQWQLHHWAISSCCILLLITIIGGGDDCLWETYNLPDGYYQLLRLAVTATAIYLGYLAAKEKRHPLIILACAALVLIFQPLAPISFERETWLWIDLATAPALLLCAMYGCKAGKPENEQT